MRTYQGRVFEIEMSHNGIPAIRVACPEGAVPAPGQYSLAFDPAQESNPLSIPLFAGEINPHEFLAIPAARVPWGPGTLLSLRGPLGHGFTLPQEARRVSLAALGETPARLMPLALQALRGGADVALFTDLLFPGLHSAIEMHPLVALPEALSWADFLALELRIDQIPAVGDFLGLAPGARPPCTGQALVITPMPCGGRAACGACAVLTRRGWKLACEDGPVLDLWEIMR
jgi:hypothetical protein